MPANRGIFTISLDFELYWGMMDVVSEKEYKTNLENTPFAITQILRLFNLYNIHATWAVVGFIYFKDKKELLENLPKIRPSYEDKNIDLYRYIRRVSLNKKSHFAPEIIDMIIKSKNQEIATHTFSHFYTLEKGQNKEHFLHDLKAAIKIAQRHGASLKSIIFPRNQCNEKYLHLLKDFGITSYRGNEKSWMYESVDFKKKSSLKQKVARFLDTYIDISSHNTYALNELSNTKPYNIPASRFLRPYSLKLAPFEKLKLSRIKKDMLYAAKKNRLYHLWWHPHNFGTHTKKNLEFLEEILEYYQRLKTLYGFESKNMNEVAKMLLIFQR